jgi:hypothetical protein
MGKPMAKWRRTYESRMRASVVTHYEKETEDGFLLLAGKDGWAGGFIWECQAEGKVLSCSKTTTLKLAKEYAEFATTLKPEARERWNKRLMAHALFGRFAEVMEPLL